MGRPREEAGGKPEYGIRILFLIVREERFFVGRVRMKGKCMGKIGVFLISCLLFSPAVASGQEEYMDSVVMREVTVEETRHKAIVKPQTLSARDLDRLSSQSVADALRFFSGVQVKDYGGIGGIKTVNIRSMGTNHVGVFYNGVQLGNAQNGQVDLGRYSLDNVEEIALYNGQKSEIFQTARDYGASSAVYITTRRPRFKEGERFHLTGQFRTGSFGLVNPSVLWEQRLSRRVHLSANVEYTYANGRYKFRYKRMRLDGGVAYDTTAVRHNGDVESLRAEAGLYGFFRDGKWSVNGYFYTSDRGIPGAIVNNVFRHGERQSDKSAFGQAAFEKRISDFYELKATGKFAWDYSNFLRDDPKELYLDNHYYQQELYLSVANLFTLTDWWRVSASLDGQMNKMNADLAEFAYPTRWTELAAVATSFDFDRFSAQLSLLGTFVQESTRSRKAYTASPDRNEWSPAFFFRYDPFDGKRLSITGFVKRNFRMPTFNDLYYTEIGNARLKPERTWQYDAGVRYDVRFEHPFFESFSLKADGYYNEVRDKIIAYPTGQQFRWTMLNLGKVRIGGVEASGRIAARAGGVGLGLNLQYTYQKACDYTDRADSYYGDQIPYTPRHSGSVAASARYAGWELNYCFIYTGERYNEQENIRYNYEQPWYTHDLSASKEFEAGRCRFKVTGELNNVFNQAYEVIHNYPMPGRNFRIALKVML